MNTRAVVLMALGIIGSLLAPGCSTYRDPATGEEARYGLETLKARLDLGIGTVYAAARRAARELDLRTMRAAEDGISAEIRAVNAQYNQVEIRLGALPEGRTQVAIHIGPFGDKNKSIVVFEQIMDNLNEVEQIAATPVVEWGAQAVGPPRGREP